MKKFIGKNVLVNVDWFTAPDGKMYRAVWGELKGVHNTKDLLGFDTTRSHANWVYEIGGCFLMGCKVSNVILCAAKPDFPEVDHVGYDNKEINIFKKPSEIYISEQSENND